MTILHDLIVLFNTTEPGKIYHEVVRIMLQNLFLLPTLSLEQTAELCNTSVITINRLLKKIQCPSFRTFKQRLQDILDGYGRHNRVFPYAQQPMDELKDTFFHRLLADIADLASHIDLAAVETICGLLHEARDIHFYCEFSSSHAKQQFQVDLVYSGKQVISLCEPADQMEDMKNLTRQSVVITTTQAALKHYADHQNMMKAASKTDAAMVAIVSSLSPIPSHYADYTLSYKGSDTALDNYFIDMLFNLMCITYRTKYIDPLY